MKSTLVWVLVLAGCWEAMKWHSPHEVSTAAKGKDGIIRRDTAKKPAVVLEETVLTPMLMLAIRDTAAGQAGLSQVFKRDYGELYTFIGQNGMRPGKPMARYYSVQPGFVLDVAVDVDRLPTTLTGRIRADSLKGGHALIVHYKGPYEQIGMAYTALDDRLRAQGKIADGRPFEVYLDDPATVQDPFELRTDIYQLLKRSR